MESILRDTVVKLFQRADSSVDGATALKFVRESTDRIGFRTFPQLWSYAAEWLQASGGGG